MGRCLRYSLVCAAVLLYQCGGSNPPDPCKDHCSNSKQDCGETKKDCGGGCTPCDQCVGAAHCSNGKQDCGETGSDCGGGCKPCDPCAGTGHCSNSKHDCGETGTDCGGVCTPCDQCKGTAHCSNGKRDCGETGKDCGGECQACKKNDAEFVAQTVPAQLAPGVAFTARVTLRNTGTTTWTEQTGHRLGSQNPQDNQTWSTGRVTLGKGVSVAPGSTHEFLLELTAPSKGGKHEFQWRMVQDNVEWFGARTRNKTIEVKAVPGWPQYKANPFSFKLKQQLPTDYQAGGIFVHDLDGDGLMDFVVTTTTSVGAYDHSGRSLWVVKPGIQSCKYQLPGLFHPGAIAGDLDGDRKQEVAWLVDCKQLLIVDGTTGKAKKRLSVANAQAVAVANLRGAGDRDAVLQISQRELRGIRLDTGAVLWTTKAYIGIEHSMARLADLDGDGRDEVAGLSLIDHDGKQMNRWDLRRDLNTSIWSVDSLVIADIVPGGPLEIALAEQGGNNEAIVVNAQKIVYHSSNPANPCCKVAGECREKDPDKVAVGDFDTKRPGLEVFCRSACGRAPWAFAADGKLIASWVVDKTKPTGWHQDGIEQVVAADWDGDERQELVLTERHTAGRAAVVNALTGKFIATFAGNAARVYAADISGDYREEIITIDTSGEVRVFWNPANNSRTRDRYWKRQHYRRQKQNWNYYSP